MAMKNPIRPAIEALEPNGIGLVAMSGLGEPDLIPLWFGESDVVTPPFIREAAKQALDGLSGPTHCVSAIGGTLSNTVASADEDCDRTQNAMPSSCQPGLTRIAARVASSTTYRWLPRPRLQPSLSESQGCR